MYINVKKLSLKQSVMAYINYYIGIDISCRPVTRPPHVTLRTIIMAVIFILCLNSFNGFKCSQ